MLEKKFGHRPAIIAFGQLPTHDLVIGELKSIHVPLKDSGVLHISINPVDFGVEKKKEETKGGPLVWNDETSKKFDAFMVPICFLYRPLFFFS